MVRSNCSILGKLLIILLTVLFTLGALAGTVFLVYKNAKVRSIANLFSDDLISESYDGTIEDFIQLLADKASNGSITLQDMFDISPALSNKADSILTNLEKSGLFKIDRSVLYSTPLNQFSTQIRSALVITGTLNDLAAWTGFTLPDLPLFNGRSFDVYTRANTAGSGEIDKEFLYSPVSYSFYSRSDVMRDNYVWQENTGKTDESGNPIYEDRRGTVVEWTDKDVFVLSAAENESDGLYYGGQALYLCTQSGDEEAPVFSYTRLTENNDAVLEVSGSAEDGYTCKFALGENQSVAIKGINTESGAYTDLAAAAGDDYAATGETLSLPSIATPFLYTPLYAAVESVPEGAQTVTVDGTMYVCVNVPAENGKYAVDPDNGGFVIQDEYKDGRTLYYADFVYTPLKTEEAKALAASDEAVYAKTQGIANLPMTYALSELSGMLDTNNMTLRDMADYFGVSFGDNAAIENVRDVPFAYLSEAMTPAISGITVDEIYSLDADSPRVMLALAYGEEGVGYEIREIKDEETGEVTGRELIVHERKTIGSVVNATDSLKIGDIVRIGDDSSRLLQAIQDWSLNDFSNSEKIDTLKLGDVLTIVTDEEAAASEGTKTASPNILQALADVSVGDMSDAINGLSVEQILGADAVEDDPLLQQLRSSTLGSLAEDIRQMTIQELFADSVYEYHETDSFAASTGDTPHRDDFAQLQSMFTEHASVYGKEYLYVKQGNAYMLASEFIEQYAAANAETPAGEDFSGNVPNALYSPYLQVQASDPNYAGVPLYYLREITETTEGGEGEGPTTVTSYKMTLASRVTGWSLPENALPDGLDESMLYVRARGADGSFKKDADGNYVYEKAAKTDGFYTESTLYYWVGQADSVKSITLTPARYELPDEFKDGRALFSRLVYAGTVGDVGALYERNELYTFDVTVQAFERAPLTNVYVNAEAPNDGNLYYCGTNGGIYRVGDLPQDGVLAPAAGVSSLLAAYFDADGKVYYYNEEGELTEAGGGSAANVSVSVRYTLDRSTETVPATGTKLYAYGNVSGLWRYLLRDEDGAFRGYTLQNVGSIVKNMSANVKTATLRELYEDGLITIKAPSGTTVQAVLDFEIPASVPTYSGQKLGDLTIGEMVLLMYALLQTP